MTEQRRSETVTVNGATGGVDGMPGVRASILETIGWTPIVKLNKVARGLPCHLLAKCEFLNPGGSVKDRIGITMLEDAEQTGRIKPGGTIVEGTSGNTGVGLAIAAAVKGYKTVFVMPDKMSDEKIRLLRAFGAKVVITPTAVEPDDPRSYYSVSRRLAEETPNAILANQYHNQVNPLTHYHSTGPEIWEQTAGRITHLVVATGTGGTISGTGRYLKERNPAIKIVAVDPVGSILYDYFKTGQMTEAHSYKVEGIGEDFLPTTTHFDVIDDMVKVTDQECFLMTRRLVREEGIFCGGSCGAAVAGAVKYIQQEKLGPEAVVVVVLPDSGSRYLSKVFNDDWMRENGFLQSPWFGGQVANLMDTRRGAEVLTAQASDRMTDVIDAMKQHNISQLPVVADGRLVGLISERDVLNHMLFARHEHTPDETIEALVETDVPVVEPDTPLERLGDIFTRDQAAVVLENGQVSGIITKIDLIDYLAAQMR